MTTLRKRGEYLHLLFALLSIVILLWPYWAMAQFRSSTLESDPATMDIEQAIRDAENVLRNEKREILTPAHDALLKLTKGQWVIGRRRGAILNAESLLEMVNAKLAELDLIGAIPQPLLSPSSAESKNGA